MFKKLFFALLALPLFLVVGCKKGDENTFVINGIHEMTMATEIGRVLAITIESTSGVQETVTLSVTGLPSGIEAKIDPASGTPNFGSIITLKQTGLVAGGNYPIKIVGTSASSSKTYDLNLVVPALNGWIFGEKIYQHSSFEVSSSSISLECGSNYSDPSISFHFGTTLPTADGTYSYKVVETTSAAGEVSIGASGYSRSIDRSDNPVMTVKVAGGKYSVNCPSVILFKAGGIFTPTLVDARQ